jgi:hypothetical protein
LQCEFCELQILIVGCRSDYSCFSVIKLDWIANKINGTKFGPFAVMEQEKMKAGADVWSKNKND